MAGVVLDENAGEAFQRAEHGAMKHHGRHFVRMLVDVERAEPAGQVKIDLHGAALPVPADCVAQDIFELRSVESTFTFVQSPRAARGFQGRHQRRFGLIPHGVLANALFRPVGKFDPHIRKPEILIN